MEKLTNISIKEYRVYDNGSVLTHGDNPILFEIEDLKIKFLFKTDKSTESLPIHLEMKENKTMEITLTNFNGIASGVEQPLKIGHLKGSSLFVHFMITSLNETGTKVLHYTFLVKDE